MSLENKIKVCIRGMSGLLGNRLALAILKQRDMEVTAGIVINDNSIEKLLNGRWSREDLPEYMYMDEPHKVVREVNKKQSKIEFIPADQLNLKKVADIVVDATSPGSRQRWEQRYEHFGKPVILQSGEYPHGKLIAPPRMEKGEGNIYRQGDCILSGLSPVLASFEDVLESVRINVLMQYSNPLRDYPTNQRINSTYLGDDLESEVRDSVEKLIRNRKVIMESIYHNPGLDYYTITLHLNTDTALSGRDIKETLSQRPRIELAPEEITSTYEVDFYLREEAIAFGENLSPVVVYTKGLDHGPKKEDIRIRFTIYSRLVAVLPNIDSIRALATGMDLLESMKITDEYEGIKKY